MPAKGEGEGGRAPVHQAGLAWHLTPMPEATQKECDRLRGIEHKKRCKPGGKGLGCCSEARLSDVAASLCADPRQLLGCLVNHEGQGQS